MIKKKVLILGNLAILTLLFGIFLIVGLTSQLSAGDLTNNTTPTKSYDPTAKTVTLSNSTGTILTTKLDSPPNYTISPGYSQFAEFQLNNSISLDKLVDGIYFYDLNNKNAQIKVPFDVKYLTIKQVENKSAKSGYDDVEVWNDFLGATVKDQNITIGLFTTVKDGDYVEWVPQFAGINITEWAIYTVTDDSGWSGEGVNYPEGQKITTNSYTTYIQNFSKSSICNANQGLISWANGTIFATTTTLSGDTFIFPQEMSFAPNTDLLLLYQDKDGGTYSAVYKSGSNPVQLGDAFTVGRACDGSGGCIQTDYMGGIITLGISNHSLEAVPPVVTLNGPPDNNLSNGTLTFNATAYDNFALSFVQLWGNFSGSWALNSTNTSAINNSNYIFRFNLPAGHYIWGYLVNDTAGNTVVSANRTLDVDTSAPQLSVFAPTGTYTSKSGIPYNVSALEDFNLSVCIAWVMRGGGVEVANTTIPCINQSSGFMNGSITVSGDADYNFFIWTNDSAGNINTTNRTFTVSTPVNTPGGGGGGGNPSITPSQPVLVKVNICEKNKPFFDEKFAIWKADMLNWEKFKATWHAFWDYSLCYNAGTVVPIELEIPSNETGV